MKKKNLTYVVNVDWFFISHRLDIAKKAHSEGFLVNVITSFTDKNNIEKLQSLGFIVHDLKISRDGLHPFSELKTLIAIFRKLLAVRPDILHLISIKPILYAGISAKFLGIKKVVYSLPGMGHVFTSEKKRFKFIQNMTLFFYKLIMNGKSNKVIIQNNFDRDYLISKKIINKKKIIMIYGSGVDLNIFNSKNKIKTKNINIMMISRLLFEKGVIEYLTAAREIKSLYHDIEFSLIGDFDDNPGSLKIDDILPFTESGIVNFHGFKKDIHKVLAKASIIVLPSYREGFPKVVMEASASGVPVITTNVPGCKDSIVNGETGMLVPPKDYQAIKDAISSFLEDRNKIEIMGYNARKHAEKYFDINKVINTHLQIYNNI